MEHFYNNVHGHFDEVDFEFYKFAIDLLPDNGHFVEIGSYKGRSSSYAAVEIANSGKKIKFDCVDTWLGSAEQKHESVVASGELYNVFISNMEPVKDYYTTVRDTSVNASKLYSDNSLDLVFIDAEHDYDSVKEDIEHWLPKVKTGGMISGHDYVEVHFQGLQQAVNEKFGKENVSTMGHCWYVIKK